MEQGLHMESSVEGVDFYIKHTFKKSKQILNMPYSPIPIFVMIIEFGKLRMSQILCFFDKFLIASRYQHLYSNIDNVVFALSTDTIDEAVDPQYWLQYQKEKSNFFISTLPGHLKHEWIISKNEQWKFVSPKTMNYAVLAQDSNQSVFKNSAINGISPDESYHTALSMLHNKMIKINQTRRVNKLLNKDVKMTTFVFNKKNV
jgi:hypothetical protein